MYEEDIQKKKDFKHAITEYIRIYQVKLQHMSNMFRVTYVKHTLNIR